MHNSYIVRLVEMEEGIEFATIIEDDTDLSNFVLGLNRDKYQITDIITVDCGLTNSMDFYRKIDGLEFGS